MSLLGKITAILGGGTGNRICVVDGDRLAGGDRVGPGERFQALNRLSRFVSREGLEGIVVFGGRPLREAEDGATFNGVQVLYAETADEVKARLLKSLSRAGAGQALLVTSDQALEAECVGRGYAVMRASTLRKAMEAPGESGDRQGGGRDRDGRRGRGRGRGGPRRGSSNRDGSGNRGPSDAEGQPPRETESSGASGGGADPTVKNLIDLVE